ncbi:MAG: phosphatase PAP2 family protein [Lacisediminihabitans sp.]
MTDRRNGSAASPRTFSEKFIAESRAIEPDVRRRYYVVAATLAILGAGLFVTILIQVVTKGALTAIDPSIENGLHAWRSSGLTVAMAVVATVSGPIVLPIIVLVLVVTWAFVAKHAWRPLLLAGGMLMGVILAYTFELLVGRTRPPVNFMLLGTDKTFSFPSGHVLGACNFMLIGVYLIYSRRHKSGEAILGFIVAFVVIAAVATCRVYLGYHWPTDVLASVCLSLVVLGTVIAVDTRRTTRITPRAPVLD